MQKMQTTVKSYKLLLILFSVLAYIIWFVCFDYCYNGNISNSENHIFMLSWIGIIVFCGYVFLWKKFTGHYFSLYTIFLSFFLAFNFGQCILWAFGIHTDNEIGVKPLYGKYAFNDLVIIKAQLMFIICFILFNLGAILIYDFKKRDRIETEIKHITATEKEFKALYYASIALSIIVIPISLYVSLQNFILGQSVGYLGLYYGEYAQRNSVFTNIMASLFLPCLIGLLIGSKYRKTTRIKVYTIFFIYALLTLLCGDRGEWINKLIILYWVDNTYFKRRDGKKLFRLCVLGFFCLFIINAIVSLREIGLSSEGFIENLLKSENPLVSLLTEFGNSMSVNMVLIAQKVNFPYGNTYVMSILSMFSTSLMESLFGIEYVQLHTWFSETFLQIEYGADFTIIGEAILNYGIYFGPIFMTIIGAIISKVIYEIENANMKPLGTCLAISSMAIILKIARATTWYVLNGCCYSVIIISAAYFFVKMFIKDKDYANKL